MKTENMPFPETLTEAVAYFSDADRAFQFMVSIRWPDGKICCPRCNKKRVSFLSTRKVWKCLECKKQFSAKVGTIFEDSALGYDKWMPAFWLIAGAKNGISSCELSRALGVTQKTAWHMLHRIRLCMHNGSMDKFSGTVEADETWIGGKARNMHRDKAKARGLKESGSCHMQPVQGLLERSSHKGHSKVKLHVIPHTGARIMQKNVRDSVKAGSQLMTDAHVSYKKLRDEFDHQFVDHAETYAKGAVHTNGLENFWALLKRTIKGTYVNVEPFHLFRYLDEQSFRFNERKDDDQGRFMKVVSAVVGKGLRYAKLIGKDAQITDCLPA
jgi:transposase-like protein